MNKETKARHQKTERQSNWKFIASSKDRADILNRQYKSPWTKEDKSNIPIPDGTDFPSMPEIKVTCEGGRKLLQKLNRGKACLPDLLPARVLKLNLTASDTYISEKLGYLLNNCTEELENSKSHREFRKWGVILAKQLQACISHKYCCI